MSLEEVEAFLIKKALARNERQCAQSSRSAWVKSQRILSALQHTVYEL